MSAGHSDPSLLICNTVAGLAPFFFDALAAAQMDCEREGLDVEIYETHRSDELQRIYYERGRTVIPPHEIVTNAESAEDGWHFYWLATDLISKSKQWDVTPEWRARVNAIARKHGLACGADWPGKFKDQPHVQWGPCPHSPTAEIKSLYAKGGIEAVWRFVGAAP